MLVLTMKLLDVAITQRFIQRFASAAASLGVDRRWSTVAMQRPDKAYITLDGSARLSCFIKSLDKNRVNGLDQAEPVPTMKTPYEKVRTVLVIPHQPSRSGKDPLFQVKQS